MYYIMTMNKRLKEIIIISIIAFLTIFIAFRYFEYQGFDDGMNVKTATVTEILNIESTEHVTLIEFNAKLSNGEIITGEQLIDNYYKPKPKEVEKNDKILVTENSETYSYASHNRIPTITFLVLLFIILIIVIGGFKGITTILSLLITTLSIFLVFIPAILSGINIYLLTLITIVFIVLTNLTLLNGFNKKTLTAIVGNILGIITAGILAFIFNNLLQVTGVIDQDYVFLSLVDGIKIDLVAIVWAGILIGSLGAIMDVSMSIASSLNELSIEMKDKTYTKLVKSGMNISKDIIGTMTNTLILAYVGSSLAVILLFTIYTKDILIILNLEMFVVEISQAIIGSIGILLTVPATVLFGSWLYTKKDV